MSVEIHAFERAGLGKAPFRCIGVEEKRGPITLPNGLQVGAPGQAMGTCAFCSQGIAECYLIQNADKKQFTVGCDCVRKTGDAGMRKAINMHVRRPILVDYLRLLA